ncbi:MAG: nucleotide exchange factor GrpE [Planctomycetes bacterium]|nr:nucleotide exchange factor GrpE [Planctomycetota bacterium]
MAKHKTRDIDHDDDLDAVPEVDPHTSEGASPAADAAGSDAGPPDDDPAVLKDRWLRARADLENVRRRARLDVDEARHYAVSSLAQTLLPVIDTLQRALDSAPEGTDAAFLEGVRLTEQQLLAALASAGVVPLETRVGDPFDPSRHRALVEQPTDEHTPGSIVAELVRGYMIHDRLLREAQVAVAKNASD